MASSGSRGCGQGKADSGAGGDALDTLTNPDLAHLPTADLVVRLNRDERSWSDLADDVALVREPRLAVADEDRARKANEEAAGLVDTFRVLEGWAANADEALARRKRNSLGFKSGRISQGERAVPREGDHQALAGVEPQIRAVELTGRKIRARDFLTAREAIVVPDILAADIEDGEITLAEIRDNMPKSTSPLRRKQEPVAASASEYKLQQPLKKPKPAGALGVASEENDSESQAEEMEEDEAQLWKKLDILKAQVAAWEFEYEAADATQLVMLQAAAPPPMEEVQTVVEAEAVETSEAKMANKLQKKIILCETRLMKVKDRTEKTEERICAEITECKEKATKTEALLQECEATVARLHENIICLCEKRNKEVNDRAEKTEEQRFCAEITDCKQKAAKTKADLWEEILLAHTSAVTELEVCRHSATEAQAQVRAASVIVARLRDESEAWKQRASETDTGLQNQDMDIATLQSKVDEGKCRLTKAKCWIRVTNFELTQLQKKIEALKQDSAMEVASKMRRATKMEEYLKENIQMLENKVVNFGGTRSNINISDRTVTIDEHNHSCMVPETGVHRVVITTGSTKKARRQKGVSFYNEVLESEMEKGKLIAGNKENEDP